MSQVTGFIFNVFSFNSKFFQIIDVSNNVNVDSGAFLSEFDHFMPDDDDG